MPVAMLLADQRLILAEKPGMMMRFFEVHEERLEKVGELKSRDDVLAYLELLDEACLLLRKHERYPRLYILTKNALPMLQAQAARWAVHLPAQFRYQRVLFAAAKARHQLRKFRESLSYLQTLRSLGWPAKDLKDWWEDAVGSLFVGELRKRTWQRSKWVVLAGAGVLVLLVATMDVLGLPLWVVAVPPLFLVVHSVVTSTVVAKQDGEAIRQELLRSYGTME